MKIKEPDASFLDTLALPYNCIYSAAKLAQDANFPAKTVMGSGPFVFVEHQQRLALDRQALRQVLGEGQALPRRLPRRVHQVAGGGDGPAGRPDPGRVPLHLARRAQPARQRAQGQDHGAGGAVGVQGRPAVQHAGQALRQSQGPPGPVDGHRPLGRLGCAVQDHHPQARRRPAAAGLAAGAQRRRAGGAAGLRPRRREVARARPSALLAEAGAAEPQVQAHQPQRQSPVHAASASS